jgi:hypothetical protein
MAAFLLDEARPLVLPMLFKAAADISLCAGLLGVTSGFAGK